MQCLLGSNREEACQSQTMQASMEGVANASAWLQEEAADMGNKAPMTWVVLYVLYYS